MDPQNCIFFNLSKANQAALRFLAQKVSVLDITPIQAMVLGFLHAEDSVTSVALGKKTELDSATLTGILDRLAAAGLIERQMHPHDRRAILILLTPAGRDMAAGAAQAIVSANKEFLASLSAAERKELLLIIGKIREQTL
jgi:DNA-binding MarR family transcriptional regulator